MSKESRVSRRVAAEKLGKLQKCFDACALRAVDAAHQKDLQRGGSLSDGSYPDEMNGKRPLPIVHVTQSTTLHAYGQLQAANSVFDRVPLSLGPESV